MQYYHFVCSCVSVNILSGSPGCMFWCNKKNEVICAWLLNVFKFFIFFLVLVKCFDLVLSS